MKRLFPFLMFLATAFRSFAPIPGTTQVFAPIAPSSVLDTYPAQLSQYGKGGLHSVTNASDLNAEIPLERRESGMLGWVQSENRLYRLDQTLTTWIPASLCFSNLASLASVSASSIAQSEAITVLGYYAPGDGGGALHYLDASTSSTNFAEPGATGGGVWKLLKWDGNALAFGLHANNQTVDETVRMQAAVDFAANTNGAIGWFYPNTNLATGGKFFASRDVYLPPGNYHFGGGTAPVYLRGVRVHGERSGRGDYNTDTVIRKVVGTNDVFEAEAGDLLYAGEVSDLTIVGTREQDYALLSTPITAVTDRFNFSVAASAIPRGTNAQVLKFAWLLSPNNHYVGFVRLASANTNTGALVVAQGNGRFWDIYATRTVDGGVLTTGYKVVFPRMTVSEAPCDAISPAFDYVHAGPSAINLRTGGNAIIRNVFIERFHSAIRIGSGLSGPRFGKNIEIARCTIGMGWQRAGCGADGFYDEIYYKGTPAAPDFETPDTDTYDNGICRVGMSALFNPGGTEVFEHFSAAGGIMEFFSDQGFGWMADHLLLDAPNGVAFWGEQAATSPSSTNAISIGRLEIRSGRPTTSPNDEGVITNFAGARAMVVISSNTTAPFRISIGQFVNMNLANDGWFDHVWDIETVLDHRITIGDSPMPLIGATNWSRTTKAPLLLHSGLTNETIVRRGWFQRGASEIGYADSSRNVIGLATDKVTIGNSSAQNALEVIGNASGIPLLQLTRVGTATNAIATTGAAGSNGQMVFRDLGLSGTYLTLIDTPSQLQYYLGSAADAGIAKSAVIEGDIATGTNIDAAGMRFDLPRGTGTGQTASADYHFYGVAQTNSGVNSMIQLELATIQSVVLTGETPLLLWDPVTGARQIVNASTADASLSGGRYLYIQGTAGTTPSFPSGSGSTNGTSVWINDASVANPNFKTLAGHDVAFSIGSTTNIFGDVQTNTITSAKIADGTISSSDIGTGAISSNNIAAAAVTTTKLSDSTVTFAKIQDETASTLLGRGDSGAGPPQVITIGPGLQISGTTLSATAGGSSITISNLFSVYGQAHIGFASDGGVPGNVWITNAVYYGHLTNAQMVAGSIHGDEITTAANGSLIQFLFDETRSDTNYVVDYEMETSLNGTFAVNTRSVDSPRSKTGFETVLVEVSSPGGVEQGWMWVTVLEKNGSGLIGTLDTLSGTNLVITGSATINNLGLSNALPVISGGTGGTNYLEAQTNLNLVVGVNVEAHDPDLTAVGALTGTGFVMRTGAGTFSTQYPPYFQVYATSNTSIAQAFTANTWTKILTNTFSFVREDSAGYWQTASGKFLPLLAGMYELNASMFYNNSAAGRVTTVIAKNGTGHPIVPTADTIILGRNVFDGTNPQSHAGAGMMRFNGSTDYAEVWALSSVATTNLVSTDQYCQFSGHWVAP